MRECQHDLGRADSIDASKLPCLPWMETLRPSGVAVKARDRVSIGCQAGLAPISRPAPSTGRRDDAGLARALPSAATPPTRALDDGPERAVLLGEALRVHPQELLEVLLDQPEERGLPRPPRPVHPRTNLHATPAAGGRDRRASRPRSPCAAGIGFGNGPESVRLSTLGPLGSSVARGSGRRPRAGWRGRLGGENPASFSHAPRMASDVFDMDPRRGAQDGR